MFYTWSYKTFLNKKPDDNLIEKLSPTPNSRHIYRWNNGRVGAVFFEAGGRLLSFREYELYKGPKETNYPEGLRPVKEGDEEKDDCKELLATGIIAYYLYMRNKMNPKDIFAEYLENEINVFYSFRDAEMEAWRPGYKKDFPYSEHLKREKVMIKTYSSRLFDFLGEEVIAEITSMTDNYIAFVQSKRTISYRDLTWKEEKQCFKKAVLNLMDLKRRKGGYLFDNDRHWMAVYRFAVDIAIMYDIEDEKTPQDPRTAQYKEFEDFAHELELDVNPPTRVPFKRKFIKDMKNSSYVRYCNPHPWLKDGLKDDRSITLCNELNEVYEAIDKYYNILIHKASITYV